MSGYQLQETPGDAAIVHKVVRKQLSNGSGFVNCFETVEQLDELENLIAENSRAILTDQSIRKYVELMPEMAELKAQQNTKAKHYWGFLGHFGGGKNRCRDSVTTFVVTVSQQML